MEWGLQTTVRKLGVLQAGKWYTQQMKWLSSARGSPVAFFSNLKKIQLRAFLQALLLFCLKAFLWIWVRAEIFHPPPWMTIWGGGYGADKINSQLITKDNKEACCPHITRKKAVWLKCWFNPVFLILLEFNRSSDKPAKWFSSLGNGVHKGPVFIVWSSFWATRLRIFNKCRENDKTHTECLSPNAYL